jgi:hypothetical protein
MRRPDREEGSPAGMIGMPTGPGIPRLATKESNNHVYQENA